VIYEPSVDVLFLFSQKKNEPKRKVVAALFSFKVSGGAYAVLSENQEATMSRVFTVCGSIC